MTSGGDDSPTNGGDAGPSSTASPTDGGSMYSGDGSELIIGGGDSGADTDAGLRIDPPEIVDGGPCNVFQEEWRADDAGAWIPATTWTLTGSGLSIAYQFGQLKGGIFQLDAPTYLTHELNPSCRYSIGVPIQIPTDPIPQDLTFMRVTNIDPDATLSFAWSPDTDDAGVHRTFLSIHLGDKEIIRAPAVAENLGMMAVGFETAANGGFAIGFSGKSDGEYFVAADASTLGLKELEIGVIDHPTTSPETMKLGVISTDESSLH